jgi:UDP:flavonoid glycosyltransferase YjiC (YdhE family)
MRILFTTQVGAGHWRPLAPLAKAAEAAGHEVAFATTPVGCAGVGRHGFHAFPAGDDDWLRPPPRAHGEPPESAQPASSDWVVANVFVRAAERRLPTLLAICRAWRPDVIVREHTEFAGCAAAEHLGLPHAALQVSAWRGDHRNVALAAPLDRLRAAVGLPPDPQLAMLHRHLLLLPCPPRYPDPAAPLPPTAHFIRHVSFDHDRPGEEGPPAWLADLPARPVVYATLGTAYHRTPGVFPAILAALRDAPVILIATVNHDQDPDAFGPQPPHVHLARYLPQGPLFARCDLVVSHGGSGTVRTAISHGLPQVLIPIAADQPENARRCAALGVARVVAPDGRTPEAIRAAVRAVLQDHGYRRNAERLGSEMRALPGPEYAVTLLEQLGRSEEPVAALHEDTSLPCVGCATSDLGAHGRSGVRGGVGTGPRTYSASAKAAKMSRQATMK